VTYYSSTTWLDARGYTRITLVRTTGGIGPVLSAWERLSNAGVQQCWEGPVSNILGTPIAALYESGTQVAILTFVCSDGTNVLLPVYAPAYSIFLADLVTVDPANADVASLISAMIANAVGASGSPVTAFVGGGIAPSV